MAQQTSAAKEKILISFSQASHSLERWVLIKAYYMCTHVINNRKTISLDDVCLK